MLHSIRTSIYCCILGLSLTGCFGGGLFVSTQDGNWEDGATWGNNSPGQNGIDYPGFNDNVIISNGDVVSQTSNESPRRVVIESNAELNGTNLLRVRNSYVNHGTHSGSGDVLLQGANDSIYGTGDITTSGLFNVTTRRVIYPGSVLTRTNGDVQCPNNDSISNRGILTMEGGTSITGAASSFFVNRSGAVLYASGDVQPNGSLVASQANNTVVYEASGTTDQVIKTSLDGYYNLSIEGDDTASAKTMSADEIILGNFKVNGSTFRALDSILISIAGDLTLTDVAHFDVVSNSANVLLNGSSTQIINGGFTFKDLTIAHGGPGVSIINDTVTVLRVLAPLSGTLNADGLLVMQSDENGDARVSVATGSISGDVTVQRYIDAGATGYRFLCAPVQGATLAQWNDDFITSGFPGSDYPSFGFNSIMFYNEPDTGFQDSGFYFPTSITDPIPTHASAWVWCGDSLGGTNPFTIDVTGPLNVGTFNYPITYTDTTSPTADGWNHVSNPYVSVIDWDDPSWTKTNVDDAIYVWNTDLDIYASYVGGLGVNGGNNLIASSQGFFVKANAEAPVLSISENCKSDQSTPFLRPLQSPIVRLFLTHEGKVRETAVRLHSEATDGCDTDWDAHHVEMSYESISLLSHRAGINYSIQSVPDKIADTIQLFMRAPGASLALSATKNTAMAGRCVTILDGLKQTIHLFETDSSILELDSTGAWSGRYSLIIIDPKQVETSPCGPVSVGIEPLETGQPITTAYAYDRTIYLVEPFTKPKYVRLYNMLGSLVYEKFTAQQTISLPRRTATGVYILEIDRQRGQKVFLH